MALELKLGISSVQDEIRLIDNTGIYNVTTNPTGYGAPNEVPGDFILSNVTITTPSGDVTVIDTFPTFPTDDSLVIVTVTPATLNIAKLPPGVYTFSYLIDSGTGALSNAYIDTVKYFHYEPIACCISKKLKSMSFSCATDEQICEVAIAERKLQAAIDAACSGNYNETTIISDQLWEKCGCCC